MPAGGHPPGIVHSFLGRAPPALHNANIGDRRVACPHPARRNIGRRSGPGAAGPGGPRAIPVRPPSGRFSAARQFWVTAAFWTVTAFFGAPSVAPPATPSAATSWTAFRPAASRVPKGV